MEERQIRKERKRNWRENSCNHFCSLFCLLRQVSLSFSFHFDFSLFCVMYFYCYLEGKIFMTVLSVYFLLSFLSFLSFFLNCIFLFPSLVKQFVSSRFVFFIVFFSYSFFSSSLICFWSCPSSSSLSLFIFPGRYLFLVFLSPPLPPPPPPPPSSRSPTHRQPPIPAVLG